MAKKRAVSLLILIASEGKNELTALLQRRGIWNHEKNKPETFPGGCQVSVHGGVEDGESDKLALSREIEEELGDCLKFEDLLNVAELDRFEDEKIEIVNFTLVISESRFLEIESVLRANLQKSGCGLVLISQNDLRKVKNLRDFDKETGVKDESVVAMFPDAIAMVEKAFNAYSQLH